MNEETVTVILARDESITTMVRIELLKRDTEELGLMGFGNQCVVERRLGLDSGRTSVWFRNLGRLMPPTKMGNNLESEHIKIFMERTFLLKN